MAMARIRPKRHVSPALAGTGQRAAEPSPQAPGWTVEVWTLEQAEANGWNEMVARHPMGSVFQHTAFGRVLAATFPHTHPCYLALSDEENGLMAGISFFSVRSWLTGNRLVSLPFAFYADPLVASQRECTLLLERVPELLKRERASHAEIKAWHATTVLEGIDVLTPRYYHRTYWLDLSNGPDAIWAGFHRTAVQQKIRRAAKSGIRVRSATCEDDVRIFHALLAKARRRLGLPPQRIAYFQNIWRHLVGCDLAGFLVAEARGETVGGLCLFQFKDTVFLGYIGTDERWHPEGVDQCLWWRAIQMAAEQGFRTMDLGKTSPYADGLMTYKRRWGAQAMETPTFYFPRCEGLACLDDETRLTHKLMRTAWRTMPPVLSRFAAQIAYRHMG